MFKDSSAWEMTTKQCEPWRTTDETLMILSENYVVRSWGATLLGCFAVRLYWLSSPTTIWVAGEIRAAADPAITTQILLTHLKTFVTFLNRISNLSHYDRFLSLHKALSHIFNMINVLQMENTYYQTM